MRSRDTCTVLVVDDNAANRYFLAHALRGAGYKVVEASTGAQGLALASSADVLLLDVFLPDMDGRDLCQRLKSGAETSRIPIIHISALFTSEADQHVGMLSGADAYLVSPIPPAILIQEVDLHIRTAAPRA